jgi:hypothetical protein
LFSQKLVTHYITSGIAIFQNQIIIVSLTAHAFSQGGESGSLIVSDRGNSSVASPPGSIVDHDGQRRFAWQHRRGGSSPF